MMIIGHSRVTRRSAREQTYWFSYVLTRGTVGDVFNALNVGSYWWSKAKRKPDWL